MQVRYTSVFPGEAVYMGTLDEISDSDFLNQYIFTIKEYGKEKVDYNIVDKGVKTFKYRVLEWLSPSEVVALDRLLHAGNADRYRHKLDVVYELEKYLNRDYFSDALPKPGCEFACLICLETFPSNIGRDDRYVEDVSCPNCGGNSNIPDFINVAFDTQTLMFARHISHSGYLDDPECIVTLDGMKEQS